MTRKTAFWIFVLGTASSGILFLWLTWDTHRQVQTLSHVDKLSPQVVEGKRLFEQYNCNDCHTILGFGGYYAPDLTKVVQRIGEDGIRYRVKSPEKAFVNSWRKMPNLKVSDAEIDSMIAFFAWVGNVDNGDWPPQDSKKRLTRGEERMVAGAGVSAGAAVFQTRGCMNCHSLHGTGGTFGPALDTIGRQLTKEQIERYIQNPKAVNPKAMMPPQSELSDKERDKVAGFLANLK
ncbi:MAG: c-type cytochrome [Nitrospiraceae bacterium]|nr:c-type cytochrome [Nitrospiraceae bacterium]